MTSLRLRLRLLICHTLVVMRAICLLLVISLVAQPQTKPPSQSAQPAEPQTETFSYAIEWRLIRAGSARLTWTGRGNSHQGDLQLNSVGLVSKLYKVDDTYRVLLDGNLCGSSSYLKALEGKRQRETRVTYDPAQKKATYVERDLVNNSTVLQKEIPIPGCVYDIVAGLQKLRTLKLEPGQATDLPVSDGKKFANVRVEAQERETVTTPLGSHSAMRYEVFLFNGVILSRKARCFVWITEDARRLPIQIRVKMQFLIGTVNLQLEKT